MNRIHGGWPFFNRRVGSSRTRDLRENLLGVGRGISTELPVLPGAIEHSHFEAFERQLLVPRLLQRLYTEGEGGLQIRQLWGDFFLQRGLYRFGLSADNGKLPLIDDAAVE